MWQWQYSHKPEDLLLAYLLNYQLMSWPQLTFTPKLLRRNSFTFSVTGNASVTSKARVCYKLWMFIKCHSEHETHFNDQQKILLIQDPQKVAGIWRVHRNSYQALILYGRSGFALIAGHKWWVWGMLGRARCVKNGKRPLVILGCCYTARHAQFHG